MITIEERAKNHFYSKKRWVGSLIDAYIEGATEQQKIDIERHCTIFQSFLVQCCGYKKDVAQQMIGQLKHALGYEND